MPLRPLTPLAGAAALLSAAPAVAAPPIQEHTCPNGVKLLILERHFSPTVSIRMIFRTGSVDAVSQGYTLTSPIDGELIARAVNPGIEVQGQYGGGTAVELFTVGELDKVWVLADVYEMDIARVKVGSKVQGKIVTYKGRVFEGTVDWVSGASRYPVEMTPLRFAPACAAASRNGRMFDTFARNVVGLQPIFVAVTSDAIA